MHVHFLVLSSIVFFFVHLIIQFPCYLFHSLIFFCFIVWNMNMISFGLCMRRRKKCALFRSDNIFMIRFNTLYRKKWKKNAPNESNLLFKKGFRENMCTNSSVNDDFFCFESSKNEKKQDFSMTTLWLNEFIPCFLFSKPIFSFETEENPILNTKIWIWLWKKKFFCCLAAARIESNQIVHTHTLPPSWEQEVRFSRIKKNAKQN